MTESTSEVKDTNIRALYEQEAEIYDKSRELFDTGYVGQKEKRIIANFLKGNSILECGVGTGRNALYFGKDFEYTGCDLSHNMIKICRDKAKNFKMEIKLVLSDAENLAFRERLFDNVICSRTIKLIPSPLIFIKESKRVLKEGGRCIVTFASLDSIWCRLYYKKVGSKIITNDKFYSSREIVNFFKKAGFSNIQIKPVANVPWGFYQALWSYVIFPSQQTSIWQPPSKYTYWSFLVNIVRLTRILKYLDPVLRKIASIIDGIARSRFLIMVVGEA